MPALRVVRAHARVWPPACVCKHAANAGAAIVLLSLLTGRLSPMAAAVQTVSPSTAAAPGCPGGGADLLIVVDNQTGGPQSVTLTGTLLSPSCPGGISTFTIVAACTPGGNGCVQSLSGLAPGLWLHRISAGAQSQYKKSIVVAADPNGFPNVISWVAFRTVLTVDRTDDSADPTLQCPSPPGMHTCTLREAMSAGSTAPAPLLIQFDPLVFPVGVPTSVQLAQPTPLPMAGYRMTVDGTDANGNPTFRGDPYSRLIDLPASAGISVTNSLCSLIGLSLQRPTLSARARPGDVVVFNGAGGPVQQSAIVNCRIDGGGGALGDKLDGQDCIEGINGAGSNWDAADLVDNTELTACPDKAVKVTTRAYLTVHDSWVHHNIGGGIQATLSGNVRAQRNLVEYSGYNRSAQVFLAANGLSANGASTSSLTTPSVLDTDGNIVRNNSARGISVGALSTAAISNDLSCGAINNSTGGQNGVAIFNDPPDPPAAATIRGTAMVYNGRSGATVTNGSRADFGQNSLDGGNNAFTQNAVNGSLGGHNLDNSAHQTNLPAIGNQWQHCYADPQQPAPACDGSISLDVNGSVDFSGPQPNRADARTLPLVIREVSPTKANAGGLIHIRGNGFDAIDGYPAGGNCTATIEQNNRCGGTIVGNCVQYEVSPGVWTDLTVESVTPAEIVVRMPPGFTCFHPVTIRVQRLDYTGTPVGATGLFCTNPLTAIPTVLVSVTPSATPTVTTSPPTVSVTPAPTATPTPSATDAATPTGAATPTVTATASPPSCVGDCNGDGRVTVDDLLTAADIALGNAGVRACEAIDANRDGRITIHEMLTAVNNAVNGCS